MPLSVNSKKGRTECNHPGSERSVDRNGVRRRLRSGSCMTGMMIARGYS